MQSPVDLIILGQTPVACLLALLVARSGHRVIVIGQPPLALFWGVASDPFAWFGESDPLWPASWVKSALRGLVLLEPEQTPVLLDFAYFNLELQSCFQAMRHDAEVWGAQFIEGEAEIVAEGIQVGNALLQATVCFDLRPESSQNDLGRWLWQSDTLLSAPGIFEIYPQQDALWIWSESVSKSYFSLPGLRLASPDLSAYFSESDSQALFPEPPCFFSHPLELKPAFWQNPVLSLSVPSLGIGPWNAVLQAFALLWARYAGQEIALRGLMDPLLIRHLQAYWHKLGRQALQKLEKMNFLR